MESLNSHLCQNCGLPSPKHSLIELQYCLWVTSDAKRTLNKENDVLSDAMKLKDAEIARLTAERDKWKVAYELADTPLNDAARLVLEDQIASLTEKLAELGKVGDTLEQHHRPLCPGCLISRDWRQALRRE
jgi:hypothetical protein